MIFLGTITVTTTAFQSPSKCNSLLIGKKTENVLNSDLYVDSWKVKVEDNPNTGMTEFIESYEGQIPIDKTEATKYLGFSISCKGDNMV